MKKSTKKENRGGSRKGAGRPAKEPTVTIRVPISLVDQVEAMKEKHSRK